MIEAARSAAAECGAGSGSSPLVVGRSPWHERLEERLARFEGQETALLFPTGFAANVGTITALVERGDLICSDRLNHASLIDGCRLSGADVYVYDRDRLERLDARLLAAHDVRRKLIVTDGVFSMDGVLAPLRRAVRAGGQTTGRCCWSTRRTGRGSSALVAAACASSWRSKTKSPSASAR